MCWVGIPPDATYHKEALLRLLEVSQRGWAQARSNSFLRQPDISALKQTILKQGTGSHFLQALSEPITADNNSRVLSSFVSSFYRCGYRWCPSCFCGVAALCILSVMSCFHLEPKPKFLGAEALDTQNKKNLNGFSNAPQRHQEIFPHG